MRRKCRKLPRVTARNVIVSKYIIVLLPRFFPAGKLINRRETSSPFVTSSLRGGTVSGTTCRNSTSFKVSLHVNLRPRIFQRTSLRDLSSADFARSIDQTTTSNEAMVEVRDPRKDSSALPTARGGKSHAGQEMPSKYQTDLKPDSLASQMSNRTWRLAAA